MDHEFKDRGFLAYAVEIKMYWNVGFLLLKKETPKHYYPSSKKRSKKERPYKVTNGRLMPH